jgi:hypothetical protein
VLLVAYIIVLYLRMRRLQRGVAALPPLAAQAAVLMCKSRMRLTNLPSPLAGEGSGERETVMIS